MKTLRVTSGALILVGIVVWLVYVWPTPWSYYSLGTVQLRVNRFTGHTQFLDVYGWHSAAKTAYDNLPDFR